MRPLDDSKIRCVLYHSYHSGLLKCRLNLMVCQRELYKVTGTKDEDKETDYQAVSGWHSRRSRGGVGEDEEKFWPGGKEKEKIERWTR